MITHEEMRVLDRNCEFFGISIQDLMENAGRAVASVVMERFGGKGKRILIACGTGNNGGDGLTCARLLKDEAKVTVVLARDAEKFSTKEAVEAYNRAKGKLTMVEAPPKFEDFIKEADIVVDALLGIGQRGELKEPYASMIKKLNAGGKTVLSVDVPSGMGSDVCVRPTATVALHETKTGMTPENSGEIIVSQIGIPPDVINKIGPGEFIHYPRKKETSHKGDNGRLLVVGGGPFTGAPAFAGMAAYRIGTDVVHVATPALVFPVVASFSPNLIVHPMAGTRLIRADISQILEIASSMDALVIGPGVGGTDATLDAVRELVKMIHVPMVLDADALTAVSKDISCLKGKKGVVTPHAREFQVVSGEKLPEDPSLRAEMVRMFAKKVGFTVLLKGPTDVISDGEHLKFNVTHNPMMTVGGTGDSLAGIVGGLLAKKMQPYDAARLAAFVNGYAGNLAAREKSYGMMTSDLIEKIPDVLREFL